MAELVNYPTNNPATVLSTGPNSAPYVVLRLAWSAPKTASPSASPGTDRPSSPGEENASINVPRKFDSDRHESSDYNKLIKELENAISRNTNAGRGRKARDSVARLGNLTRLRGQIQGIYKEQESAFKQWERDARDTAAQGGVRLGPARFQVKTTLEPSDQ